MELCSLFDKREQELDHVESDQFHQLNQTFEDHKIPIENMSNEMSSKRRTRGNSLSIHRDEKQMQWNSWKVWEPIMMKHHFVRNKSIEQENPNDDNFFDVNRMEMSTCSMRSFSRPPDGQVKNVSF